MRRSAKIADSVYEIRIRPGIRYQPHPAFAVDERASRSMPISIATSCAASNAWPISTRTGTRELTADDYIYEIKRLAHPRLHSPIFGMMAEHIVGLKEFGASVQKAARESAEKGGPADAWLDLDRFPLKGVTRVDRHTYAHQAARQVSAVPLLAGHAVLCAGAARSRPLLQPAGHGREEPDARLVSGRHRPLHADAEQPEQPHGARAQSQFSRRNLSLRTARRETAAAGLLADCGKPLPFIEQAVFSREKESIPYWNKFLQGYYDASGISSDSFDQAVRLNVGGDVQLSDEMRDKGIRLLTSVRASTFYMGFNMLDPVVGTLSDSATRKLRQALSIAIDQEEFISIFMNGRGIAATSPLPPGIFGYLEGEAGSNPVVYDWGRWRAQAASRSRRRKTAGRGRLAEWARRQKRRTAGAQPRHDRAAAWATSRGSTG